MSIPDTKPPLIFEWGAWRWDIAAALALIAAAPREAKTITVAPWLQFMGVMRVNTDHAAQVDLSIPLLLAPFLGAYMVIDGWHRLWRAEREGVERLPAYLLTAAEEKKIRLRTGGGA